MTERHIELPPPKVEFREVIREVPRPFIDSDGDGVPDERDKCPDTPHGMKVDSDGCIIPDQIIELRGVTFEFNKTRLSPNAGAVLDAVVKAFIGQPSLRVEIGGHTDSIGSDQYNLKLSQGRADAVRNYLVGAGARPEQITAVGYGESRLLINPEKNDDDRELNRRVEFKVVGN
jgi:OOP family OmpA-OmpF porin